MQTQLEKAVHKEQGLIWHGCKRGCVKAEQHKLIRALPKLGLRKESVQCNTVINYLPFCTYRV